MGTDKHISERAVAANPWVIATIGARRFLPILVALISFGITGCAIYVDHPPERTISGPLVDSKTGKPIQFATIDFSSGRKTFVLLGDTFGIEAVAKTDENGRFSVKARLNDRVQALVQDGGILGHFVISQFPPSNHAEGQVWKISSEDPYSPAASREH